MLRFNDYIDDLGEEALGQEVRLTWGEDELLSLHEYIRDRGMREALG
jgi:hypothetical protein